MGIKSFSIHSQIEFELIQTERKEEARPDLFKDEKVKTFRKVYNHFTRLAEIFRCPTLYVFNSILYQKNATNDLFALALVCFSNPHLRPFSAPFDNFFMRIACDKHETNYLASISRISSKMRKKIARGRQIVFFH